MATPTELPSMPAGNVYVYDSFYHYIEKLSSTGESLRSFSNINATGIAVDPSNGDLYLDEGGNSLVRYSFNGSGEADRHKDHYF